MNIVILAAQILGDRISSGGDRVFVEMARRWLPRHRVTVICPAEAVASLREEIPEVSVLPLPRYPWTHSRIALKRIYTVPLVYLMRSLGALSCLGRCRGDALFLSGDFFCNVIPAVVRRGRFRLLVANVFHINESVFRRRSNPLLNTLVSFLLQRMSFGFIRRFADLIFLLNRQVEARLGRLGFPAERMHVMGAGVDVAAIARVRPGRGYDGVFFGRLYPTKGCLDLPVIWRTVTDEIPGARLGIIGVGSEALGLQMARDFEALGLSGRVDFLGFLPYGEVYGILKASGVFLSPSYEEGWGITICEAFVCGLPAVAYDLPVFGEIFPGVLETVPPGDRAGFGRKVVGLLRDRAQAERLARAGREQVARYDWGAMAVREMALFEEALEEAKGGRD